MKFTLSTFLLFIFSGLDGWEWTGVYHQGSGVGYNDHYTKMELYHVFETTNYKPFIDIRYLLLEKEKQGANFGRSIL